jgi:hypothetical protein
MPLFSQSQQHEDFIDAMRYGPMHAALGQAPYGSQHQQATAGEALAMEQHRRHQQRDYESRQMAYEPTEQIYTKSVPLRDIRMWKMVGPHEYEEEWEQFKYESQLELGRANKLKFDKRRNPSRQEEHWIATVIVPTKREVMAYEKNPFPIQKVKLNWKEKLRKEVNDYLK